MVFEQKLFGFIYYILALYITFGFIYYNSLDDVMYSAETQFLGRFVSLLCICCHSEKLNIMLK